MEGTIKNGYSRDTGKIEHTRHRRKTEQNTKTQHRKLKRLSNTDPTKNTTQKTKKIEQHGPH